MNLQEFADSVTEFNDLNTSNLVLVANSETSTQAEAHVNTGSLSINFNQLTDGNNYLSAGLLTEDTYSYGLLTFPDKANIEVLNISDITDRIPPTSEDLI
jgi:hypothetical protein